MIQDTDFAPYTAVATVKQVLDQLRERTLPDPVNQGVLERISVAPGLISRTIQTLKFLGLIDDDGCHTDTMTRLKRIASNEYQELLAEVVKGAYASVFEIIHDPNSATDQQIVDSFRHFKPEGQRGRMVTLFLGLCREAGLIDEGRSNKSSPRRPTIKVAQKSVNGRPKESSSLLPKPPITPIENAPIKPKTDHAWIQPLLDRIPESGTWTFKERDKWLNALQANLNLWIEVEDDETN